MPVRSDSGGLFADDPFGREPARAPREEAAPKLYSVGELTRSIQGALERLGRVSVEGEVSRVMRANSGHVYFDLKDIDAKIACTVWRSALPTALKFELEEGQQIIAHGKLDVYGPRGAYSLIVQRLEQKGLGALLVQLEKLKDELRARGWFDRKRPLPFLPRTIGVVTSRDGAALQDFLRTRALRWPLYPAILAHTAVQGRDAARDIAAAIRRLDAAGVDVIVVVRGGGSLEDLWSFNELAVAEAVWETRVPVVSGVGHQTDTTLIDLVADHRAHTPTDAAQTVIPDRAALAAQLESSSGELERAVDELLTQRERELDRLGRSRALREAGLGLDLRVERLQAGSRSLRLGVENALARMQARIERLAHALESASPAVRLGELATRNQRTQERLRAPLERALARREQSLAVASARLEAVSPYRVLARGYSITRKRGASAPLTSIAGLAAGDAIETLFADGRALSRVERTLPAADSSGATAPKA